MRHECGTLHDGGADAAMDAADRAPREGAAAPRPRAAAGEARRDAVRNLAHDPARYLATLPLFAGLGSAGLARLAAGCALKKVARGAGLFRVGDACEGLHVAVSGQVKLFALSPGGHEKVIEIVGPHRCFMMALMFTGRPHIVNAEALSPVQLLTLSKTTVLEAIADDPRVALGLLAGIGRRLHELVADVQAYTLQSGVQRVIGYLLREAAGEAPTVQLGVSKATLASRLSLSPEYFSRVLHELEERGLIRVERRNIHIVDLAQLARYPEP
jgi:CRP-like cAMP-binding protein